MTHLERERQHLAEARMHVAKGRQRIRQQIERVRALRADGPDTAQSIQLSFA